MFTLKFEQVTELGTLYNSIGIFQRNSQEVLSIYNSLNKSIALKNIEKKDRL